MPPHPRCSIAIVYFRTPRQIRLCLRALRRHTATGGELEVIVVDNGSGPDDPGLAWLRTLGWIRLLERNDAFPSHQRALDAALAAARGETLCVLHSDTYVHRTGWLAFLHAQLASGAAMVGSDERVLLPAGGAAAALGAWWRARRRARRWKRRGRSPKLLTHCALYRRELFDRHGLRFDVPERQDGRFVDTGEPIQRYCERAGLGVAVVPGHELARWVWHFEGATLNAVRNRPLAWKRRLRAWHFWRRPEVRQLLEDDALDR